MSETFTLTIFDAENPAQSAAHESAHPTIAAAVAALDETLREADEGDHTVTHPTDWFEQRPVFDVLDRHDEYVGTAVIERN